MRQGFEAYMASAAFVSLAKSPVTRANRSAVYRRLIKNQGDRPLAKIRSTDISAALAAKTPSGALADYKAMKPAFAWLASIGLIAEDPMKGVERPVLAPTEGYETWNADDVRAFQKRWRRGTLQRRVFDLALYTGQRRADLVKLSAKMVSEDVLTIRQQKTGATAHVPFTAELREAVRGAPDIPTWLVTSYGRPFSAAGLGNFFREAADAAKVSKSLHGLRKAFCVYWAEKGLGAPSIAAMSGHKRLDEVQHYIAAADRRKMVAALISHADLGNATEALREHVEISGKISAMVRPTGVVDDQ